MKKLCYFSVGLLLILLTGCGSSAERMKQQITALETRLFETENGFTRTGADSLTDLYIGYAEAFPADSLSPLYLFKAATMVMNMNNGMKAISLFEQMQKTYPDHEKTPLCLFFTGYVHENIFGDIDQARENYTLFIETYPGHDFADDAQASINNLGKTPEEMIREFEALQNQTKAGN